MPFDSLLPLGRPRQPDDNYDVRFAGKYADAIERDLGPIHGRSRKVKARPFVPDDLCEEFLKASEHLARGSSQAACETDFTQMTEVARF